MVKRKIIVPVVLSLVLLATFAATTTSAAPSHSVVQDNTAHPAIDWNVSMATMPHRPESGPCDHGSVLSNIYKWSPTDPDGGQDYIIHSYLQKLVDTSGVYCGYSQAFTSVNAVRVWPFGPEPFVAAYTQLWQANQSLYLGGYSWSGLGYAQNDQSTWWFYGPRIWVTCNSPVEGWGDWQEQNNANGEWYLVTSNTQPAEGQATGAWSATVAPC